MPKNPQAKAQQSSTTLPTGAGAGRIVVIVGIALVAAIGVGYLTGAIGDRVVGIMMAAAIGLAAAGRFATTMLESAGSGAARASVVVLSAMLLALAVVPAVLTVEPGTPVARGGLAAAGDSFRVPGSTQGSVRLLVHGDLSTQGAAAVDFELGGATKPLTGRIERSISTTRVGRRGVGQEAHERNSEFLDGSLAAGQSSLKLERVEGPLAGALDVAVYPDRFPLGIDILVGAVVLALAALLAARLQVGSDTVVLAGLAIGFGAVCHELVTPDSVVRPMIGAMIVGGIAGIAAGGLTGWGARKLLPAQQKRRA
jgi:hypothetical protein